MFSKNTALLLVLFVLYVLPLHAQHLYDEKFENCKLSTFCLDCGDPKAQPPKTIFKEMIARIGEQKWNSLNGTLEIQILVDTAGKPCLLSADNKTNMTSANMNIKNAVNEMSYWTPAIAENKKTSASVSIILQFENGKMSAKRRIFDFGNQSNMKTVGTPDRKGSEKTDLTETWTVYTQDNSELPWDMSRAVSVDQKGVVWIGTDNGIVSISDEKWKHFNNDNIGFSNGKKNMSAVRNIAVDQKDNKWFVVGYDVYKFDNAKWLRYDSINSPINWARNIYIDRSDNVWFTSWRGVIKFDGSKWSTIDTKNSKLPADKTLSVFVDSKERTWIGTFEGNVRIDKGVMVKLDEKSSPLSKAAISKIYEDKKGNLFFSLYDEKRSDAGMYILGTDGKWQRLIDEDPKMFVANSINDFFFDEERNVLWISQNNVGILKYHLQSKKLEIYTNQNSNVPSVNIERIAKDKDGAIWAATYAGIIKTNIK